MPLSRSRKAKSARRCRAVSARRSCTFSRSSPNRCARSRRSPPSSSRNYRGRARQGRHPQALRQDRGRAHRRQDRWPRPPRRSSSSPRTVEAIDRSGRAPSGQPVAVPDAQRLLPSAFSAEVGAERDPLQFEGGYVWFEVTGITPSRDRPLDEVKDQVEARWREQEIATRLKAKADRNPRQAQSRIDVRRGRRGQPAQRPDPDRHQAGRHPSPALGRGGRSRSSAPAKTSLAAPMPRRPRSRSCSASPTSSCPTLDVASEEAKKAQDTLNRAVAEDMFSQYIARLEDEIGVTINQSALSQVISGWCGRRQTDLMQIEPQATGVRQALRAEARPRSSGPRWSPTSKRRCRPFSRSPAAGR